MSMTSDQQAEFERMHGYYVSQGERYSFSELWQRVVKARIELLESFAKVKDADADWSPSAENWSIREVVHHVLNSSRNTRKLVSALSIGEAGDSSEVDPLRTATDISMDELGDKLRDDGIEWTTVIHQLPPRPSIEPTAPHGMFGELHARAWFLFQRTHDLDHKGQIESVLAADAYPENLDNSDKTRNMEAGG